MSETADLNPTIVEALYGEALALADEARIAFDGSYVAAGPEESDARTALSREALRTTTRMMHALAWLLNQRAYFAGELSELQLNRHGRLPPPQAEADPGQLALLPAGVIALIERTVHFYERVERIDRAWRERSRIEPPVHRLRERLGRSVAQL